MSSRSQTLVWTALAAMISPAAALFMPNGTGKVPTMGWNSWNAYHCDVDADKIMEAAQGLVDTGLQAAGYNYVNIDDCWSNMTGRIDGRISPNMTAFPNGIDGLADQIHNMSFKMGIYSSAGTLTCAGYPASIGNEEIDAATFASWGIDYLKYDNCNIPSDLVDEYVFCSSPSYVNTTANGTCTTALDPDLAPPGYNWTTSNSFKRYNAMHEALSNQTREIALSQCIWGTGGIYYWSNLTGISFRMSNDVQPDWADVTRIINENSFRLNFLDFYNHNDMDMLEVGNGDLTAEETRSHFALWSALKSPLIIGTNISALSDDNLAILKNPLLLAFNQDDTVALPATPYKWGTNPDWTFNETWPAEFWSGNSSNGTMVLLLNPSNATVEKTALWTEIPTLQNASYQVTDVWTGDALGCLSSYTANVSSHDTAVVLVGDEC